MSPHCPRDPSLLGSSQGYLSERHARIHQNASTRADSKTVALNAAILRYKSVSEVTQNSQRGQVYPQRAQQEARGAHYGVRKSIYFPMRTHTLTRFGQEAKHER